MSAGSAALPREEIAPGAWRVMAITATAVFVVFLDATVVNIAFPAISRSFPDASLAGLSWVLNAYAVVLGALLVTGGRLADDRGRKRVFMAGLGLFAVSSALCGAAVSLEMLIAARALQAVGAALLVPSSLALVLPEFPLAKRGMAVGVWGAVGAVAAAVGPSLGAVLVEGPGWRWVFYINVPVCAAAWLAARHVISESTGDRLPGRPDLLGVLLVTSVFGLLTLGVVQGGDWGWTSGRVLGCLAAAAVLAPLLVIRALRHPAPVLPVRLFAVRSFGAATAGTLLFAAAFFAAILANVLFLTGVWQWSELKTGLAIMPGPLSGALAAPLAGRLADRFGYRAVIAPGCLVFAAGLAMLSLRVSATPSYLSEFLPGLLLTGIGIGLAFPTLAAAGASALPPALYGGGSAVVSAARQLGAVLGVAGLVAILEGFGRAELLAAFHHSWGAAAAVGVLCAATALALGRPSRTAERPENAVLA